MSATFIFLMVVLKLPIFALLYIVWYAIQKPPLPEPVTDEDGGTKKPLSPRPRHPHPRPALPRNPRRGPHGPPPCPRRRACAPSSPPAVAASSTDRLPDRP